MLKTVICSTEGVPFAKTGGLADVVGALPFSLKKFDMEIIVILPGYNFTFSKNYNFEKIAQNIEVIMNKNYKEYFDIFKTNYNGIDFYFVKNEKFFNREYLYGTPEGDYDDNNIRFGFFSKAILKLLKIIKYKADIIHLHDYHVAMISVLINEIKTKKTDSFFDNSHTIFTIHNLAYQGIYDKKTLDLLEIDKKYFNIEGLEFYGKINYMKGGIVYSEKITTVSPTYSKEILTSEFGYGLDGILRTRQKDLSGIINGIDYNIWNPEMDKLIRNNYNSNNFSGKQKCKKFLVKDLFNANDITKPVFGMVSRLSNQKGIDLLIKAFDSLMLEDLYIIILGTGDEKYLTVLKELNKKYSKQFYLDTGFSEKLAREIYSGADIFLMPSYYEPCGLGQLISLKYGTIPVVRDTGGLKDTIINIDSEADIKNGGQGFKFSNYEFKELIKAVNRALGFYYNKKLWEKIMKNGMICNYSWDSSAKKYRELFVSLI